jgi:hypothetical protein
MKSYHYLSSRCPECIWALYDGWMCQNPSCVEYTHDVSHKKFRILREHAAWLLDMKERNETIIHRSASGET